MRDAISLVLLKTHPYQVKPTNRDPDRRAYFCPTCEVEYHLEATLSEDRHDIKECWENHLAEGHKNAIKNFPRD